MDNRKKNIIYTLILTGGGFHCLCFTAEIRSEEPIRVEGKTMGTTYHITYFDNKSRNFKNSIDSLLIVVNKSINNYDPTSEVSRFNTNTTGFKFELPYLYAPLKKAQEVFHCQ